MTKLSRRLRQIRLERRPQIHVPHSSWSRVETPSESASLAPEEFWSRLGL